jgi:predicted transcriptional regulator
MAEVTIRENVWQRLVEVARLRRKSPESLADAALREFLRREADEDLLERSSRTARTTGFPLGRTEEIIRQHRQRKKKP